MATGAAPRSTIGKARTAWPTTPPARVPPRCWLAKGCGPRRPAGTSRWLVEAVRAQFPGVPGLTSLDRVRRRRNQAEYPQPETYDPISASEVEDAIRVADDCIATVRRLVELDELGVF